MRADQAKTIPLDLYLEHQGYKPAKTRMGGRELWYKSPIRSGDSSPSFKVDTIINKWYDHGIGRGGNTLDLAIELCCSSVRDALRHLERTGLYSPYGYRQSSQPTHLPELLDQRRFAIEKEKDGGTAMKLLHKGPVKHPALLQYLDKRKIASTLVEKYLHQIHFTPPDQSKKYFAIGWPAGSGYEARNSLFKGFVGVGKDITYLEARDSSVCAVFEGFFDFLAYLSFHNHSELPFSVVVLNSGALKARAVAQILEGKYDGVRLFLDNDQVGDAGTTYFQELLGTISVDDCRDQYRGFKDFNEMTMSDSPGFSFSS